MAGGMNLYGYAGGDPINNSDPFGLCPDPARPECEEGGVVAVGLSAGFAFSTIGANVEVGVAVNRKSGAFLLFAGIGNSLGAGASAGGEATIQSGSLQDFLGSGTTDQNKNASELEAGAGGVGLNLVVGADPERADKKSVIGMGANAGPGGGIMWNLRAKTVATKAIPLAERWRALPALTISPHH